MNIQKKINKNAAIHYFIAASIFSLYGGRVCPFIETIALWQASLYAFITFIIMYSVRFVVIRETNINTLIKELVIFSIGAIGLSLWYHAIYDFPMTSNIKVLFGVIGLGLLISLDLILQAQVLSYPNIVTKSLPSQRNHLQHSIAMQMAALVIFIIVVLSVTLAMVVVKDIHWLAANLSAYNHQSTIASIIKEFVFIAVILISYAIIILHHWLQLLRLLLDSQQQVLISASEGDLSARVPVTRQGELGVIAYYTNVMLEKLNQHRQEIIQTRDVAIVGLSALAESRDNETGGHILRTQGYVRALAIELQQSPKYRQYLTQETVDLLYKSAPLHDIGKVGIPDAILLKPGKLSEDEFKIMKTHAQIGADSISVAEKQMGSNSFLFIAREIALTHHEKWDGSGYPNQLQGDEIPLSGRLMALADVYDALISKRIYKPAFSHDKAKSIIIEGRDSHFDPEVVDAFLRCEQKFVSIARTYNDDQKAI